VSDRLLQQYCCLSDLSAAKTASPRAPQAPWRTPGAGGSSSSFPRWAPTWGRCSRRRPQRRPARRRRLPTYSSSLVGHRPTLARRRAPQVSWLRRSCTGAGSRWQTTVRQAGTAAAVLALPPPPAAAGFQTRILLCWRAAVDGPPQSCGSAAMC
jgi:hypothetical protein